MKVVLFALLLAGCASKPIAVEQTYDRFANKNEFKFNQQLVVWRSESLLVLQSIGLYPYWKEGDKQVQLNVVFEKTRSGAFPEAYTSPNVKLFFLIDGDKRWELDTAILGWKVNLEQAIHIYWIAADLHSALAQARTIELRYGPKEITLNAEAVAHLRSYFGRVRLPDQSLH